MAPERASLRVNSKNELRSALAWLVADAAGIQHAAFGPVNSQTTYVANVREPPADPTLPGFGSSAFQINADGALNAFKHFCRSQLGQRSFFVLHFDEIPAPRWEAIAAFDGIVYGAGYLSLWEGSRVAPLPAPSDPEGWAFGALLDGTRGWYPPSYVREL